MINVGLKARIFLKQLPIILFYALALGSLSGILYLIVFIQRNRYLPENVREIFWYLLKHSVNNLTLKTFFGIVILVIAFTIFKKYVNFLASFLLSCALFAIIGYFINKNYLPEFYSIYSIIANISLIFIAIIVAFVFRNKISFNLSKFEKFYRRTFLFVLASIFLFINVMGIWQGKDLSTVNIERITDRDFLKLFDLSYPGLEKVASLSAAGEYKQAIDALFEYYANRDDQTWLFDRRHYSDLDSTYFLKRGNEALNHEFTIRGLHAKLPKNIDWSYAPYDNKEWIYRLNTHYYWVHLAYAYFITGNEKFAEEINNELIDWVFENPVIKWKNESLPTWRLLETGCRLKEGWPLAFQLCYNSKSFSKESKMIMLAAIYNQAQFLRLFKSPKRNHLLFESMGLASAGIFFPEFKNSSVWRKTAFARINKLIDDEINNDGSYIEVATNYHKTVSLLFDEVRDLAKRVDSEETIDQIHEQKIKSLFDFMAKIIRPDGMLPAVNDGHSVEAVDVLQLIAEKYGREDFNFITSGYKKGNVPNYISCDLPDAGFYIMRDKWDSLANYLFVDAGPFGSAHGHEDKLNIELFARGRLFLVDPGTYTYNVKDPFRWYFLRSFSHNTVIVDGKSQARFWNKNTWQYGDRNKNENIWISNPDYDYLEAAYKDGYGNYKEKVDKSIQHIRKILFIKPDYWVLSDLLIGKGEHLFEQMFHFMPMSLDSSNENEVTSVNEKGANLALIPLDEDNLSLNIFIGSENPIQGWVAPAFHKKLPAPTVIYSKKQQAPAKFITVLFPQIGHIDLSDIELTSIPVLVNNEVENQQNKAICLRFRTQAWTDYIMISENINGIKEFGNFKSYKDIAYFRVDRSEKIVRHFEFDVID